MTIIKAKLRNGDELVILNGVHLLHVADTLKPIKSLQGMAVKEGEKMVI